MKYLALVCPVVVTLMLSGCGGVDPNVIKQNYHSWKGQTDTALTSTFGFPQKTVELQGGTKVYHYDFPEGCAADFEIDSRQIVSDVKLSGSDLSKCPHKLPGGGTF